MNLTQWGIKWGVPYAALDDLRREFGTVSTEPSPIAGESEAAVQNRIRLEASRAGCRLWRNNVGAFEDEGGGWVRYGLCNDSKQMNKMIKSSDLVGIRPVAIGPQHIGQTIGQFIAREVKEADWAFSGTEHELAQLKFLELVASLGGDAAFATSEGTI